MRLESEAGTPGGIQQVILSNIAKKVTYIDIAGQWFKVPMDALAAAGVSEARAQFHPVRIGQRSIDGKACTGYRVSSPDGGIVVEQWLWGNYPILATMRGPAGLTTVRYLSLSPAQTPDSYFEPPQGVAMQELGVSLGGGAAAMPQNPSQELPGDSDAQLQRLLGQ